MGILYYLIHPNDFQVMYPQRVLRIPKLCPLVGSGILYMNHFCLVLHFQGIRFMPQPVNQTSSVAVRVNYGNLHRQSCEKRGPSSTPTNHRAASLQTVNLPVWHLGVHQGMDTDGLSDIHEQSMRHEGDEQSKQR